jgi:class 3 adenylate cyclase/tetratricopeptide (TPR) repeat protein
MTETGTVTLLFTDLAGSTELLSRLGDDAAEQLRRTHFGLLREAAAHHAGHEVKSLGDGLMVAFPSALRAVECAVAMQQAIAGHNEENAQPLGLRVGVNAGEAITEEDDYFGTAVVVAKRLCDRAEAGQILLSELVHSLVGSRGGHRFHPLGPLSLKGLADPVMACEVAWRIAHDQATRSPVRDSGAPEDDDAVIPLPSLLAAETAAGFAGRQQQLDRLLAHFESVCAGRRQLVLLAGEPGIGKTRLASELGQRAHEQEATVLYGHSDEETLVPFQPFVEAIEHYVTHSSEAELRRHLSAGAGELSRLWPELRRRFPQIPEPAAGDPDTERYRMFEAVSSSLALVAERAPLVLVLDDLHWADKPTLLLLKHLVRSPLRSRLLIVGTYRDVDVSRGDPLAETLVDLGRDRLFDRLALEGLTEDEVAAFISRWAGQQPPRTLARAIWQETEGHPFFVQEVLRHLLETGAIRVEEGRLITTASIERIGIPEGVRDVIGSRLARLPETARRVLIVASVIGRDFDADLLERVSEISGDELLELLEDVVAAGVITEAPGVVGRYRFAHALIREALYGELSAARRVRLHERIGCALEELHVDDRAIHLSELAHHFFEAAAASGVIEKAIDYETQAGERARAQLAYEEAAEHYERAYRGLALRGGDPARSCRLLLALGENQWRAGEFTAARAAFWKAAEIAEEIGFADGLAPAALGFAGQIGVEAGVVDTAAIELLERALAALPDEDTPLRTRLLARLAEMLTFVGSRERRAALSTEALAMARRLGDKGLIAEVLSTTHFSLWGPDDVEGQLATIRETVRLATEAHATTLVLEGRLVGAAHLLELGAIAAFDAELAALRQHVAELREPYYMWLVDVLVAMRCLVDGPLEEGERLAWEAVERGRNRHNPSSLELFGVQIFYVRLLQGRVAELHASAQAVADHFSAIPALRCGLAAICCEGGRERDARREFERLVVNDFEDLPRDMFWLTCMDLLTDVCVFLGDGPRAAQLYDRLAPYAEQCIVEGAFAVLLGSAHRPLGMLAALLRRWDDAAEHFEQALAANARLGALRALAITQYEYARMLLDRDAGGDRDRAADLLEQAQDGGQRLGMESLVRKVRDLAGKGQDDTARPRSPRRRRARAALSTRGRAALAKLYGDASDPELERRFGSSLAQRALMSALAHSFQPAMAYGFEGEILFEITHPGDGEAGGESDWWTIEIAGGRATVSRRVASAPVFTLHTGVPEFIRLVAGEVNPVTAWVEGRIEMEGDLTLGPRLAELFGGVTPFEALASGGGGG